MRLYAFRFRSHSLPLRLSVSPSPNLDALSVSLPSSLCLSPPSPPCPYLTLRRSLSAARSLARLVAAVVHTHSSSARYSCLVHLRSCNGTEEPHTRKKTKQNKTNKEKTR